MPPARRTQRAPQASTGERVLRIVALLFLVAIFALGGLYNGSLKSTTTTISDTPAPGSPTALIFPTVPPGGTPLISDYTYFHPSAVFSIPHFAGFEIPQNGEERTDPSQGSGLTRAGATFINGSMLSVVHVFIENDPTRTAKVVADLDKYYDVTNLKAAWQNFTGGYKETGRRTEGDKFIIDFELYLDGNTYLGRQVSRFEQNWLMVSRLVTPNNNQALMDQLQSRIWNAFVFYPSEATTPILWSSLADVGSGYVIKYPPNWTKLQGASNAPYILSGAAGSLTVTLTTQAEPGKAAKTEPDARVWIANHNAKATVQTVSPFTSGSASGFNVSYTDPDPDGNPRSAVVTLLNGANGTLYSANVLTNSRTLNLLNGDDKTIPLELAQIRGSLMLLETTKLVPTLTPTITPTFTPTTPTTSTSTVAATSTPLPPTAAPTSTPKAAAF